MTDDGLDQLPDDIARLLRAERGPLPAVPPAVAAALLARVTATVHAPVAAGAVLFKPAMLLALAVAVGATALVTVGIARRDAVQPAVATIPAVAPRHVALPPAVAPTPMAAAPAPAPAVVAPAVVAPAVVAPAPAVVPVHARQPAATPPPRAEHALLEAARAALARGDPQAALVSLAEHQRGYPHGALAEECAALTVMAHARAGDGAAPALAERFGAAFPGSLFLPAVQAAAR